MTVTHSRTTQTPADYKVPSYFSDDLFHLVSERRRPPYRWFLVGPERSGTTVHIDPLATSAWNTLLYGKKRWVLFPPHVPRHVVKGKGLIRSDEDDEAIHYFMTILPRIKRRAHSVGNHGDYRNFACYEFTQNEGETVFIPNGWWHAVLNLTDTVGITQNFCSPRNFDQVWLKTRTGRKRMAYKWLCQLDEHYPHLAQRARAMNERDGFVMKYDPVEVKRREEEVERRRQLRKLEKEELERNRRDERLLAEEEELIRKEHRFLEAETRRQEEQEKIRQREQAIFDEEERRRSAEMKRSTHSRNSQRDIYGGSGRCLTQQGGSKRSRLDSRHVSS
jgi:histone arginine demethylase JMJD6